LTTSNNGIDGAGVLEGLKLIDSDTHYSEPYDFWTSRAPSKYREKVLPYVFEGVDYEFLEDFPSDPAPDRPSAAEMFRKNCYATFWFENAGPLRLLDIIGADNVMWETDFPHPSCLHPDAVRRSAETLAALGPDVLRKVVQDNAANLYNIDLGDRAC
jgi:hypothetical protein